MSDLAPILQGFFTDRMITQKHASEHTIRSYRDTWRLLLAFAQDATGTPPWKLDWSPGIFVDNSIMLLLVPNCQVGARNPLGLSCRADVVSGRDCNIARCSRTRRS